MAIAELREAERKLKKVAEEVMEVRGLIEGYMETEEWADAILEILAHVQGMRRDMRKKT